MRYLLVAAAVLVAAPMSAAQAQAVSAGQAAKVAEAINTEIASIKSRMKLTPDQELKLKKHLADASAAYDKLDLDYEKKDKEISEKYRKKMRGELTPEQQSEWDKIKSEYRTKLKAPKTGM